MLKIVDQRQRAVPKHPSIIGTLPLCPTYASLPEPLQRSQLHDRLDQLGLCALA